jgi:hypothetical protein
MATGLCAQHPADVVIVAVDAANHEATAVHQQHQWQQGCCCRRRIDAQRDGMVLGRVDGQVVDRTHGLNIDRTDTLAWLAQLRDRRLLHRRLAAKIPQQLFGFRRERHAVR